MNLSKASIGKILDGKKISEKIIKELKPEIKKYQPCLAVIFVGDSGASQVYVRNKKIACEKCGILYREFKFNSDIQENELLDIIEKINSDPTIHGFIVQLPLPQHIFVPKILKAINPSKDVDGFTAYNVGKMFASKDFEDLPPATPAGIIRLLDEYQIEVKGMNAVVIGRSNIVGKPIAMMLINRQATVTVCNSRTKNISQYTKEADLVIVAIGQVKFLTADMIKKGAVVVDVGINRDENNNLCGDVDFSNIKDKCLYLTPVPGGVGPMTIAQLMVNVVRAAKTNSQQKKQT